MTPTLLAFLDDVEHNRIPADEVRHRARLARHEAEKSAAVLDPPVDKVLLLRKALTWCGHATPESIETLGWEAHRHLWRVVACVASWSDRQVSGPSSAPIEGVDVGRMRDLVPACFADEDEVPLTYIKAGELRALVAAASRYQEQHAIVARIWGQLGSPTYEQLAGRSIYDLIDELKALASTLPERVAEAVMGEREACALWCDGQATKLTAEGNILAALEYALAAKAIRSRPAPAHPMAGVRDEVVETLRPFAVAAEDLDPRDNDRASIWEHPAAGGIDVRDLRRAKATLDRLTAFAPINDPTCKDYLQVADDRVQRVVEAAPTAPRPWRVSVDLHGYVHVLDAKSTPVVRIFNGRDFDNATAIAKLIVDSVNAPAPGAPDHG